MARSNTSSPVVATRLFLANARYAQDINGRVKRDNRGRPVRDEKNGITNIEKVNFIRNEVEAFIETGELDLAEAQCRGLMKIEQFMGYNSGEKLMERIEVLKEEQKVAKTEEFLQKCLQWKEETRARHDQKRRVSNMASLMEQIEQEEASKRRAEMAREQREKEMAEVRKQRELRQLAKEDRNVWLAHHEELDTGLTHNPFAALQGITPAPAPVVEEVKPVEAAVEVVEEPVVEMATETEVNTILAMYTAAIEACQEMGQWNEVQELLGDEFFNRNVTEELVTELCDAAELVAMEADNQ